jgi:hypothetical protein
MPATIGENRFLAELAYNRGDVVLRNMPEVLGIESTNHCNIKCIMCPRGEPDLMRRPVGHMPTSLLEQIIDQVEFFTEPAWLHWFGEPLMNPSLFEQIEIANDVSNSRRRPDVGGGGREPLAAALISSGFFINLLGAGTMAGKDAV